MDDINTHEMVDQVYYNVRSEIEREVLSQIHNYCGLGELLYDIYNAVNKEVSIETSYKLRNELEHEQTK